MVHENGVMPALLYRLPMVSITSSVASDPWEVSVLLIGSVTELVFSGSHQGYVSNAGTGALAFGEPSSPGKAGMVVAEAVPASPTPNRRETAMAATPSDDATAEACRSLRRFMISGFPFSLRARTCKPL